MQRQVSHSIYLRALLALALCFTPNLINSQSPVPRSLSSSVGPYGNCMPLNHAGVNICYPSSNPTATEPVYIPSPFQLVGIGTGGGGPVQRIELWADGNKLTQVYTYVFDKPITLAEGRHNLTLVEVDSTGSYVKSQFGVEVLPAQSAAFCDPPSSPGVHVCEPFSPTACHTTGYITFYATGKAASGYVKRMELWVGNTKLANFPGNKIYTHLYIGDYQKITFIEVDSNGGYIKSPVYTTFSC